MTTRTWTYRYKSPVDGRMRQVKIGAWPAMSVAAAAGEWEKLRAARDAGADPAAEKRQIKQSAGDMVTQASNYLMRHVCNDYLAGHVDRRRKPKGATEVRRMFKTMLGALGDKTAEQITRADAFDLINSFADIPVQAKKLRSELAAAWSYAHDSGRLPETVPNWWRLIMHGRLRSNGKKIQGEPIGVTKRYLSDTETGELIRWLPNFSRLLEEALTLYLWTGTRGVEIMAMEGCELTEEPDGLWWTIPKRKTKNARYPEAMDHRVPLTGRAERIVRRRWQVAGNGYLFPSNGALSGGHTQQKVISEGVYYYQPYSEVRPERKRPRLTVTHWAPHDLRRTVRTMLAATGCPKEVGEVIIGHMLKGVEGTYNRHTYDRERRLWLTRVSDRLEELAETR